MNYPSTEEVLREERKMREIEIFLKLLEKEGLQKGYLEYTGIEYIFQEGEYRSTPGSKADNGLKDERIFLPAEAEKERAPVHEINLEESTQRIPEEFPIKGKPDEGRPWRKSIYIPLIIGVLVHLETRVFVLNNRNMEQSEN